MSKGHLDFGSTVFGMCSTAFAMRQNALRLARIPVPAHCLLAVVGVCLEVRGPKSLGNRPCNPGETTEGFTNRQAESASVGTRGSLMGLHGFSTAIGGQSTAIGSANMMLKGEQWSPGLFPVSFFEDMHGSNNIAPLGAWECNEISA